jgi:hypothetical protein
MLVKPIQRYSTSYDFIQDLFRVRQMYAIIFNAIQSYSKLFKVIQISGISSSRASSRSETSV